MFKNNQIFGIGEIVEAFVTVNNEIGQVKIRFEILSEPEDYMGLRRYLVKDVEQKYFTEPIYVFDLAIVGPCE